MLVDTKMAIALRSIQGSYDVKEISIFELINLTEVMEGLKISTSRTKNVTLNIKCHLCGKYHNYEYSSLELVNRQVIIAGCEELGIPILFIGKSHKIKERINRYRQINTTILAMI